jgi:hypothetical protein
MHISTKTRIGVINAWHRLLRLCGRWLCVFGMAMGLAACPRGGPGTEPPLVVAPAGCSRPAVLSSIPDTTVEIASLGIKQITLGGFKYQSKPQLVDAFSAMSKDSLIIEYQVCLAMLKYGYDPKQAEWLRSQLLFMALHPTPEQADSWLEKHPFPGFRKGADSGDTVQGDKVINIKGINTNSGDINIEQK